MPMTRYAKVSMTLSLAAFAWMVAYNNLSDYGSNFAFVEHVLRMDTTFEGSAVRSRALREPWQWHTAYALIIATELLVAGLLTLGGLQMWRQRHATPAQFHRAKHWAMAGFLAAFMLWFTGFAVVGGEWFAMWQSTVWNGLDSSFRFSMTMLGVCIFVNQSDVPAES
jgi:predicted small integral membrane protein